MIIFRKIEKDMPSNWKPIHWYAEFHDDKWDMAFPLGIAFLTIAPVINRIDFIFVADQHRRKGVATALIKACEEKWPDIDTGEAISEAGEKLLESLG